MRISYNVKSQDDLLILCNSECADDRAAAARLMFSVPPKVAESMLLDPSAGVRLAWITSNNFVPTHEQVERGLSSNSEKERLAWLRRNDIVLNMTQLRTLMLDQSSQVRLLASFRSVSMVLIDDVVEIGITDRDESIRLAWARHPFTPSTKHLSIVLSDPSKLVRLAWLSREDFELSSEQATQLMKCGDIDIIIALGNRHDWTCTRKQAEKYATYGLGLGRLSHIGVSEDIMRDVRKAWVGRPEWTPTYKQFIRGLYEHYEVRREWVKRTDYAIPTKVAEYLISKNDNYTTAHLLKRQDWVLSTSLAEKLHKCVNEDIRLTLAKRPDLVPTMSMISNGIRDQSRYVRLQWACRQDKVTDDQINEGLLDDDREVAEAWKRRVMECNSDVIDEYEDPVLSI